MINYTAQNGEPEGDFAQWVEWADKYLTDLNPLKKDFPKFDVVEFNQWFRR